MRHKDYDTIFLVCFVFLVILCNVCTVRWLRRAGHEHQQVEIIQGDPNPAEETTSNQV